MNTFGIVHDYFGLESASLVAESSNSGESKHHITAYNKSTEAVTSETGGIWMNPSVTYRVVSDTTLKVSLGTAFSGDEIRSGYMITSVSVETRIGESPRVTISAVANEGANAINTYALSIPLSPRHRPHVLLSSMTCHGDLQSLSLSAACDPVVLAENNMPCASDIVHGRIEVTAESMAYDGENDPEAKTGWTLIGNQISGSGIGWRRINTSIRKDL